MLRNVLRREEGGNTSAVVEGEAGRGQGQAGGRLEGAGGREEGGVLVEGDREEDPTWFSSSRW